MRKLILFIVTLFLLTFTASAYAQQEKVDVYQNQKLVKSVVFQVGLNEYFVNDQTPGVKMDVAPFVETGRTFVPVRFLSNALGVQNQNIYWLGDTGKVKLQEPGFSVVELTVGKVEVLSNGEPVSGVDVAPLLRDSRTFLPARFVAEALGYQVEWDEKTQTVVCWPKGEPKPDVSKVMDYLQKQGEKQPPVQQEGWTLMGYSDNKVAVPPGSTIVEGNGNYYKNGVQIRTKSFSDTVAIFTTTADCLLPGVTFDQMLATAREVLMQTFQDQAFVEKLMSLVAQKSDSFKTSIPLTILTAPDGRPVMVDDDGDGVIICIRPPGQSF